jgi:large subunit ribosomal protein L25
MEINDTLTLEALTPPSTVALLDDPETVIATLSPPRLQLEAEDEIESETEVVGEGEEGAAGEGEEGEGAAEGGDAEASGGSDAE